ncbi:MAG: transporter substrate-binding domain-containing protein [Myxococcales bacterium]|nr:transporter substrate-binding domain-containing protein [Myxococcales bacterium]
MTRAVGPLLVALLAASPALAGDAPTEAPSPQDNLRVGVSPLPPFVLPGAPLKGYSVDLWRAVAIKLDRPYELIMCKGAADKLTRLERGELDAAIGGITVTPDGEARVDFTHPSFRSGLAILLPGVEAVPSLWTRLGYALGRTRSTVVVAFFLLVVIAGHLVWFFERGKDAFDDKYWPGVFEGVYWAVVTASTVGYGDKAPVRPLGRVLAMLVIIISLPMFAYFTAELASAFTVIDTQANITTPADLKGQQVGVVRGTAAATYAARLGLNIRQWDTADDLYSGLESGRVAAAIHDAPSLRYYAETAGRDKVHVSGPELDITNLAMATQSRSPLREDINRALLELDQEGVMLELRVKWFGAP